MREKDEHVQCSLRPAFTPRASECGFFVPANLLRGWFSLQSDPRFGNRKLKSLDMLYEQLDGQLQLVQLEPLQGEEFFILKRDGRVVPFEETRIVLAIESAFKADAGLHRDQSLPDAAQCNVMRVANAVIAAAIAHAVR